MLRCCRTSPALIVAAALSAALVAGCSGSGDGPITRTTSAMAGLVSGTAEPQTPITEQLPEVARCPRVRIQPETEVVRRDDGSGDPKKLNWQASLTRVARECRDAGDGGMALRVGVAGRVIRGPAGAPERIELPVRIAVRQGGSVVSSEVRRVGVTLSGPSQDWAYVEENVVVAAPNGAEVLVGFES
jgi:hypothetical protein